MAMQLLVPTNRRSGLLALLALVLQLITPNLQSQVVFKSGFEPFETACFNGEDDDGDGFPDCADSDCNGKVRKHYSSSGTGMGRVSAFRSAITGEEYFAAPFPTTISGWILSGNNFVPTGSVLSGGTVTDTVFADTAGFKPYLFYTTSDGYIKSLDVSDWTAYQSRNLKRGGCGSDKLTRRPVLQLHAESNDAFQSQFDGDLVYVGTRHECGDTTQNQVKALNALDLTADPVWTFNFGEYEVDAIENCTMDDSSNTLYCGTDLGSGAFQNTIWAINTLDGSLRWAANVGALHVAPLLVEQLVDPPFRHLVVLSTDGVMRALNPDSGEEYWSVPAPPGFSTGAFESDLSSALYFVNPVIVHSIKSTASFVALRQVYDAGSFEGAGFEVWSTDLVSTPFSTDNPVLQIYGPGSAQKVYQAVNTGRSYQFDLSSGSDEANFSTGGLLPNPIDGHLIAYRPYANSAEQLVGSASNAAGGYSIRIGCGAYPVSYIE